MCQTITKNTGKDYQGTVGYKLFLTKCLWYSMVVPHSSPEVPTQFPIGLYRENAIAIESEARDPFGGNVYYVTMQITFSIPEFTRKERNLHCDVVHLIPKWVSRLVLDHAIAAIQTSR